MADVDGTPGSLNFWFKNLGRTPPGGTIEFAAVGVSTHILERISVLGI